MPSTASQTGTTLFAILRQPNDSHAWSRFVDRYGPQVFGWCRARGLQQADAENVTQEVLSKFVNAAKTFQYDPAKSGIDQFKRAVERAGYKAP